MYICIRKELGILDTGTHRFRPAFAGYEQTCPCVIGKDGIGVGIIQTDILVILRLKVLVKRDGVFRAVHRLSLRSQDILVLFTLLTYTVFTDEQIRTHVLRLHVIDGCHSLPRIRPVVKRAGGSKTRRHTRMGQEIPLTALHKRDSHTDFTFVFRDRIERHVSSAQIHGVFSGNTGNIHGTATFRFGIPSCENIIAQQTRRLYGHLRLAQHRVTGFYCISKVTVIVILYPLARIGRHELQASVMFVFIYIDAAPTVSTDNRSTSHDWNGISFLLHTPAANIKSGVRCTELRSGI